MIVKLELSSELAYWLGIVQTDGYFKKYLDKNTKIVKYIIVMMVRKSLPMLKKFQELSFELFDRKAKIFKIKKGWECHIGVKRLLEEFSKLEFDFKKPPKPPDWCINNIKFFGAYMAGVIDGDGTVCIKRPKYPQCAIQIESNKFARKLKYSIEKCLNCSVNHSDKDIERTLEGRKIRSHIHRLEFYLSSKNYLIFEDFILSWLSLPHKRDKISRFISYLKYKFN